MLLPILALCALAGFTAKLVDERVDSHLPIPWLVAGIFAVLYGLSAGLLVTNTVLSSLFLGLAVAAVLSNKFDHPLHLLGLLAFLVVLVAQPIAFFDPWLFSLFLVLGLLDELELKLLRALSILNKERLWVPLGALALALWDVLNPALSWSNPLQTLGELAGATGVIIFLGIVFFDLAYRLSDYAGRMAFKSSPIRAAPSKRRGA